MNARTKTAPSVSLLLRFLSLLSITNILNPRPVIASFCFTKLSITSEQPHCFTAVHASQGWLGLLCLSADPSCRTTKRHAVCILAHNVFVCGAVCLCFSFQVARASAHSRQVLSLSLAASAPLRLTSGTALASFTCLAPLLGVQCVPASAPPLFPSLRTLNSLASARKVSFDGFGQRKRFAQMERTRQVSKPFGCLPRITPALGQSHNSRTS